MKVEKLNTMTGGWFIGDFLPTLLPTQNVEVAVKKYNAGQYENEHFHKIAKEFTVIISGVVEILGQKYNEGDIIVVDPFESIDFKALTDVTTLVVKIPGAKNDKYIL
jgi:hypothetical protein